jgi:hypothetical protein
MLYKEGLGAGYQHSIKDHAGADVYINIMNKQTAFKKVATAGQCATKEGSALYTLTTESGQTVQAC